MFFRAVILGCALVPAVCAQQAPAPSMGSVSTADANVSGGLEVSGARARLVSNASITAYDHSAPVSLARGGEVVVCSTSQFHLLHSGAGASLLFGLDRGAIEVRGKTAPEDVILTPDIRFSLETAGTLDLRLRVTRNGDTCVENAGVNAPTLLLSDAFSPAVYRLTPGQHVLFEHGSLREVVDNESTPCGCPAVGAGTQLATGAGAGAASEAGTMGPVQRAEAAHPFPAAASQDLAATPAPPITAKAADAPHAQIATTLTYTPGQPPPATSAPVGAMPVSPEGAPPAYAEPNGKGADQGPPPVAPPAPGDVFHAIGRFFHRLFHPGAKKASVDAGSAAAKP